MQTFDQVLERFVRDRLISYEDGLRYSTNETNLRLALSDWRDASKGAPRPVRGKGDSHRDLSEHEVELEP